MQKKSKRTPTGKVHCKKKRKQKEKININSTTYIKYHGATHFDSAVSDADVDADEDAGAAVEDAGGDATAASVAVPRNERIASRFENLRGATTKKNQKMNGNTMKRVEMDWRNKSKRLAILYTGIMILSISPLCNCSVLNESNTSAPPPLTLCPTYRFRSAVS